MSKADSGTAEAPREPKVEQRIDKMVVVAIRTTYVDGRPVKEDQSDQVVLYRAAVSDPWAFLDRALKGPRKE